MKFEIYHPTGNEFCIQCGDKIETAYIKLNQNRWAKPKLCLKCLSDFVVAIQTGNIPERDRKVIVQKIEIIQKNSWMAL